MFLLDASDCPASTIYGGSASFNYVCPLVSMPSLVASSTAYVLR